MSSSELFISPAFQSLRLALDEAALHQQAISSNIANVNTPGFKRLDVSANFEQAYSQAMKSLSQGETVDENLPTGSIETAAVQGPARPDGNTVQIEQEMLGMAQNSARYEFASQVLASNYHGMKFAITGQN
jgi:flagellar basal-body rod protein FlgB